MFITIFQGFRIVPAEECWYRSMAPLMAEVREQMGDGPVYLTFDIDSLDPAFAPGTGKYDIHMTISVLVIALFEKVNTTYHVYQISSTQISPGRAFLLHEGVGA